MNKMDRVDIKKAYLVNFMISNEIFLYCVEMNTGYQYMQNDFTTG